jgi:hypothetical protein
MLAGVLLAHYRHDTGENYTPFLQLELGMTWNRYGDRGYIPDGHAFLGQPAGDERAGLQPEIRSSSHARLGCFYKSRGVLQSTRLR